ncbi:uncharacterized protein LOC135689271 [Rhopilema esculentum]|uniref:uncharacterized protein LOC135689271 n=1 Tax=Rhopilema esculentum TaxID=499914 RepID=UPI0031D0429D
MFTHYLCHQGDLHIAESIDNLKVKTASFLTEKVATWSSSMGRATKVTKTTEERKTNETKWRLPNLFRQKVVGDELLPTGYMCETNAPYPNRKCDIEDCQKVYPPGAYLAVATPFTCNAFCLHSAHVSLAKTILFLTRMALVKHQIMERTFPMQRVKTVLRTTMFLVIWKATTLTGRTS